MMDARVMEHITVEGDYFSYLAERPITFDEPSGMWELHVMETGECFASRDRKVVAELRAYGWQSGNVYLEDESK